MPAKISLCCSGGILKKQKKILNKNRPVFFFVCKFEFTDREKFRIVSFSIISENFPVPKGWSRTNPSLSWIFAFTFWLCRCSQLAVQSNGNDKQRSHKNRPSKLIVFPVRVAVKNKNCNSFQYFTFLQEEEDFEDLLASVEDLQDYEEVGEEEAGEEAGEEVGEEDVDDEKEIE